MNRTANKGDTMTITATERRAAEEADRREDFASIASRIGRLADARDACALSLAELRARDGAGSADIRRRQSQLHDYDRELAELRGTPTVTTYQVTSALTFRPVRKATRVTFADGRAVAFLERLPKGKAIEQARAELERQDKAREDALARRLATA
jgi:hypothetical protein